VTLIDSYITLIQHKFSLWCFIVSVVSVVPSQKGDSESIEKAVMIGLGCGLHQQA